MLDSKHYPEIDVKLISKMSSKLQLSLGAVYLCADLLDERHTRSDIIGEEYGTEVNQLAEPVTGGT